MKDFLFALGRAAHPMLQRVKNTVTRTSPRRSVRHPNHRIYHPHTARFFSILL